MKYFQLYKCRNTHKIWVFFSFILCLVFFNISTGISQDLGDESKFYVQTKQVNQFFRRFNGEENKKGVRIYKDNKFFRSYKLRKAAISTIFDHQLLLSKQSQIKEFADYILDKKDPKFLDFHGGHWFAELDIIIKYKNRDNKMKWFLTLEEQNTGSKWVLDDVYFYEYEKEYAVDTVQTTHFLHPLSHEIGFINIFKELRKAENINMFISKDKAKIDQLSVFRRDVKNKALKIESVGSLSFHFFQLKDYYFKLQFVNNTSFNTGWLITDFTKGSAKQLASIKNNILFKE